MNFFSQLSQFGKYRWLFQPVSPAEYPSLSEMYRAFHHFEFKGLTVWQEWELETIFNSNYPGARVQKSSSGGFTVFNVYEVRQ